MLIYGIIWEFSDFGRVFLRENMQPTINGDFLWIVGNFGDVVGISWN